MILFLVCVDSRSVVISYNSTRAPAFHLHEPVTFICNATGFAKLVALRLFYHHMNKIDKIGCVKVLSTWESTNKLRNGIVGKDFDESYCSTIGREDGFALDVKLSFTDSSLTGFFTCRAQDRDLGEVPSLRVEVKEIKGKLV